MKNSTLYIVGDSTVSSFNDPYYYPRYGYGTQLKNYFKPEITIINLAMSGRSSKSYIIEENYQILKKSLKAGDFLMIGFGHNDQKSEDKLRFTDATKPLESKDSFLFYLNEYYIKLALKVGAIPILCTPIVRLNVEDDYTKEAVHDTPNGDYANAILSLGNMLKVTVLDLREMTKLEYKRIGYLEARLYHAILLGKYSEDRRTTLPNFATVDSTHLNIFGAKFVAYLVASLLMKSDCPLKSYLLDDIKKPTKEEALVSNPNYVVKEYFSPHLISYMPKEQFKTTSEGWYGTAFGDCGGIPNQIEEGYRALEISPLVFTVGQHAEAVKGKISLSTDGFAYVFKQIDVKYNFELTATAKVLVASNVKQAGFGLMLRDDCYLDQERSLEPISSNYLAAGFVTGEDNMHVLFKRETSNLFKEPHQLPIYLEGDIADLKIVRVGQSITLHVKYQGNTYIKTYYDFDLLAVDPSFMYIGLFATRGTLVEFRDVQFKITGNSQGA